MEKVDIFKTIEKATYAGFLGMDSFYVSGVDDDYCYSLFEDDDSPLFNDKEEFAKIINKELDDGGIYIALAYLSEGVSDENDNLFGVDTAIGSFDINANEIHVDLTSDYGIIVDKSLDFKYIHRCMGNFASGAFYVPLENGEKQLEKIIHDCIVFFE